MNEIETEMVSRRKALSLLGLGRRSVSRYRRRWSRWRPKHRRPRDPAAPAAATGTHGMQRRQGRRTHRHERRHGRHERRHTGEPGNRARRNSSGAIGDPSAFERQIARDGLRIAYPFGGPRNARDRRRKEKEETKVPHYRRIHGKASCDGRTVAPRIRSGACGRSLRETRHACLGARIATETHSDQDRTFGAMVRAPRSLPSVRIR